MIAVYNAEIIIAIFQSVSEHPQSRMKIVVKLRANRGKIARFN